MHQSLNVVQPQSDPQLGSNPDGSLSSGLSPGIGRHVAFFLSGADKPGNACDEGVAAKTEKTRAR